MSSSGPLAEVPSLVRVASGLGDTALPEAFPLLKRATLQAIGGSALAYAARKLAPTVLQSLPPPAHAIFVNVLPIGVYVGVTGFCWHFQPEVGALFNRVAERLKVDGLLKYYAFRKHVQAAVDLVTLGCYVFPICIGVLLNAPAGTTRLLFSVIWAEMVPVIAEGCYLGDRISYGLAALGSLLLPFNKRLVAIKAVRRYLPMLINAATIGWKRHPYEYSPIHPTEERIRLLEIRPGILGPRYSLKAFDLYSAPPFEAISYRWGSEAKSCQIKVSGRNLHIPQSAFDVVKQAASSWRTRYLWVDAICVNQLDSADKTCQVLLMRKIFGRASRVIVWLGASPDAILAWYFFGILVQQQHNPIKPEVLHTASMKRIDHNNPKWAAFNKLLDNPYWSRVWIVQEIAVAKRIDINYGGFWWDWEAFVDIVAELGSPEDNTLLQKVDAVEGMATPSFRGINLINTIQSFRKRCRDGGQLSLTDLLLNFATSKASLEVDHIFAFQGISTAAIENAVVPNYTRSSPLEMYEQAAAHSFSAPIGQNRFKFLSIAGIGRSRTDEPWPTWMPDFEWMSNMPPAMLPQSLQSRDAYHASSMMADLMSPLIQGPDINHEICSLGKHIDEIIAVTGLPPVDLGSWQGLGDSGSLEEKQSVEMMRGRDKRMKEAQALVELHCDDPYFTGQSRWEAFWRTLIGDMSPGSYPADPEYGNYLKSFLEIQQRFGDVLLGDADSTVAYPQGFGDLLASVVDNKPAGSIEDTLNTIEKILDPAGVLGGVRQILTPELVSNRPRLFNELANSVALPYWHTSRILKSLESQQESLSEKRGDKPNPAVPNVLAPELEEAWLDLMYRIHDVTRGDDQTKFRQMTLLMGFLYADTHIAFTPEQFSSLRQISEVRQQWSIVSNQSRISLFLNKAFGQRQFAVTKKGYMALVPLETTPGDLLSILIGAPTPYILRRASGSHAGAFFLVGEAYAHGFMTGLAFISNSEPIKALRIA